MEEELEVIGRAVRRHRATGGGLRLPPRLREQLAIAAQQARVAGWSVNAIAKLAGVSSQSIMRWTRREAPMATTRLVPVRLASAPTGPHHRAQTLTLVSPTGWQVRGLDLSSAAAFLRAIK